MTDLRADHDDAATDAILGEAAARLRARDYPAAEALLRGHSDARAIALLGDACFLQGRHDEAAAAYREALTHVPGAHDWEARAERAWADHE